MSARTAAQMRNELEIIQNECAQDAREYTEMAGNRGHSHDNGYFLGHAHALERISSKLAELVVGAVEAGTSVDRPIVIAAVTAEVVTECAGRTPSEIGNAVADRLEWAADARRRSAPMDEDKSVVHTSCMHCGQDIEGCAPYTFGDRG